MHGVEGLPAGWCCNGSEVHNGICAFNGSAHRIWIAHVGLHCMDLADIAHRLQMAGQVWPANGCPDPPTTPRQGAHRMPPDKTGPSENRSKFAVAWMCCHFPISILVATAQAAARSGYISAGRWPQQLCCGLVAFVNWQHCPIKPPNSSSIMLPLRQPCPDHPSRSRILIWYIFKKLYMLTR